VDDYIAKTKIDAPEEKLPILRDGFVQKELLDLDLKSSGIGSVIWATGYKFDFSFVKLPVVDADGFPIQQWGVTNYQGLYFVGMPWLHNAKSGLLYGVGEDAAYIASRITIDDRPSLPTDLEDAPADSWLSHDCCCP
jgi:putative flavoprotein involved in K+ transport